MPPADFTVALEDDAASIADGLTVTWTPATGADGDISVAITIWRSGNLLFTRLAVGDSGSFDVSGADLVPANTQVPALAEGQTIRVHVARTAEADATLDGLAGATFRAIVNADTTAALGP